MLTLLFILWFMQIESLSVTFHGHELVADSTLELNYGRYVEIFRVNISSLHLNYELAWVSGVFLQFSFFSRAEQKKMV